MNAQELTLNIAVNLGRIGRWATEKKEARVRQFLIQTEDYLAQLARTPHSARFEPTFQKFSKEFQTLKNNVQLDDAWAEAMFTWANILTHRAKLT